MGENLEMVPRFIRSDTEFQAAVQLGITTESIGMDFKQTIDNHQPDIQKETCRDIAQFANTWGGCLLVGIEEEIDSTRKLRVAKAIKPLADADGLKQWIEQAIVNYLVPSTFSHDITTVVLPVGNILAVNVPASRHLVSLWDRQSHTVEYLRRTSHGKAWMNPDEAERHLMDGSRAAKLAFMEAVERTPSEQPKKAEIGGGIWIRRSHTPHQLRFWKIADFTIGEMQEFVFELRMCHDSMLYSVTVPYSLIREAWLGSSGMVTLLLTVKVVMRVESEGARFTLTLEP